MGISEAGENIFGKDGPKGVYTIIPGYSERKRGLDAQEDFNRRG